MKTTIKKGWHTIPDEEAAALVAPEPEGPIERPILPRGGSVGDWMNLGGMLLKVPHPISGQELISRPENMGSIWELKYMLGLSVEIVREHPDIFSGMVDSPEKYRTQLLVVFHTTDCVGIGKVTTKYWIWSWPLKTEATFPLFAIMMDRSVVPGNTYQRGDYPGDRSNDSVVIVRAQSPHPLNEKHKVWEVIDT